MSAVLDAISVDELTDEEVSAFLARRKALKQSTEQKDALEQAAVVFNTLSKLAKQASELARKGEADNLAALMVDYYSQQNLLTGGFGDEINEKTGKRKWVNGLSSPGGFTKKRGLEVLESRETS